MPDVTLTPDEALTLVSAALVAAGASQSNADATARALVNAEIDGQRGHGLTRTSSYAAQAASGKVNGVAVPKLTEVSPALSRIDADYGFAYPAINLAIDDLSIRAKRQGIAACAIFRSHHFGQAGAHVERLAKHGLIGLLFGNSPKAIAFWGSAQPALGTNPVAFAAPVKGASPVVIDLALSVAARGKILAAQKEGDPIPEGWAFDIHGEPTTNADAALAGSMAPLGGAKGAALALMVEILAAALTGGNFGFEASSLFSSEGDAPALGHVLVAVDPDGISSDAYWDRMATLVGAINDTPGARLPGRRRIENRSNVEKEGLTISQALHQEILQLAGVVS
ncbi:MAG: Ldh family oxidoreductase [Pseudomonadota bacterium]